MKNNWLSQMTALLAGMAFTFSTHAATLKIGDPAPKLQNGKWVQGEAVTEFKAGKMYVVEFWATWCGPCKASIPHLNELYQKFKDKVVVIGQDVWEQDEDRVAPFVKSMGDKMTYRVALDDKSKVEKGAMAANWMEAAGQSGIPTAFIVNQQGKIAWIGHPMEMNEKLWNDILGGQYDLAKAAADYDQREKNQKQLMDLSRKLSLAMRAQKWDDAEAALSEIEKVLPEDERGGADMVRFQILLGKKNYDGAYKFAGSLSEQHPDNVMIQNELAWTILTREGLEKRDLPLAEKIAERANKAAGGKEPGILDTLARAQFMNGKKKEAIATAQKAVDLADGEMKDQLKKTLASYQADKLPSAND